MNPLYITDGYKTGHHIQYPEGTTLVYSNFTPRSNKYGPSGSEGVVVAGVQYFLRQLEAIWTINFFARHKKDVIDEIKREFSMYLNLDYDTTHFEKLHDLGYLPLVFKALPEGTFCPVKVPMLTVYNTHPDFYWLPNFLETTISNNLWQPMTSATIALQYKKLLTQWAKKTNPAAVDFVNFQAHDFSMRGMGGLDATILSGIGHAFCFSGGDSLPVIPVLRGHYMAKNFIYGSIPATEHSVMCAGTKDDELGTFRRLLSLYPDGFVGVVSDTWDLWNVLTVIAPALKEEIMARDGKLVFRPDSGDPVDILCGLPYQTIASRDEWDNFSKNVKFEGEFHVLETHDEDGEPIFKKLGKQPSEAELKGVIELLWDVFGGTINDSGYKVLDNHVGAIYGDSITLDRAEQICARLEAKGFASTNVVFGIGSYTYQYNTRDTFGFAMKATYCEVSENYTEPGMMTTFPLYRTVGREIFKDPITDDGTKKSATGLLQVYRVKGAHGDSRFYLKDKCTWEEESEGELQVVFENGVLANQTTLAEIRERVDNLIEYTR